MLRYIEIVLFGAFMMVLVRGTWNTSIETVNPPLFVLAVLATFIFGWKLPKIIEYVKGRWKQ